MAKDGKSTVMPRLRFSEFREAWEEHELGEFLTESRISGNDGSVAKKLTVKLWGNGVFEKAETIKGSASTQYYKRKAGQFIYSKLDFLNQAFGVIPDHLDGYESTVDLPCFDVGVGLNSQFLLKYVQRKDFYKRFGEIADGGRKAKRIQVEPFFSFPIAIPKKTEEQQKIADCLTSLDEVIAVQGRKVAALKAHKRGLMQQLFPREGETLPRLRLPEFQNAGEWASEELSRCLKNVIDYRGKAPPKSNSGIPLITAKNVRFGWLDMTNDEYIEEGEYGNWMSKGIPQAGDILFTTEAPLGNVALFPSTGKFALGQRIITLRSRTENCLPEFLFQSLLGPRMQEEIDFHGTGSTARGIKSAVFVKISFCYPGIEEQRRIADCLTALDGLIVAQTQKLEALKTQKKGLMQQLFPSLEEV